MLPNFLLWAWMVLAPATVDMLPAEDVKPGPPPLVAMEHQGVRFEFVKIPPGEFLMGCSPGDDDCADEEKPAHRVRITKGFELGKTEVTQAQWQAVRGVNPSSYIGPDRPVEEFSWDDAQEFLKRLNARNDGYRYRLPTEAEWEYAARVGTTGKYTGELDAIAWHRSNSEQHSHPVGQKQPNAWGLYDMHGNVWEWCQDWYVEGYYAGSPRVDPPGPSSGTGRVRRGGSWNADVWLVRVSYRVWSVPGYRSSQIGLRCLREVIP
jgi:formylglycine-generating enzyme required for sulfatase activity